MIFLGAFSFSEGIVRVNPQTLLSFSLSAFFI
jgi:hypothetical protein